MGRLKTRLERRRLKKVYYRRLRQCRRHLNDWDASNGRQVEALCGDPSRLDAYLARYLEAHRAGVPVYVPKHAVYFMSYLTIGSLGEIAPDLG